VGGVSETLTGRHALSGDEPDDVNMQSNADGLADPDDDTRSMEPPLQPPLALPTPGAFTEHQITCPECGTVAMVALSRRESSDFCARCDYPLFWTPTTIVLDASASNGESLRRLPGAAGQAVVASVPCPHCAEGNALAAVVCVRCGGLMNPPEPAPVVVAPPPPLPTPAPEPERTLPLWVWLVGGTTLLLLMALVVYFFANR
jgi:hypothetical protein